jgi:hypothetical protein
MSSVLAEDPEVRRGIRWFQSMLTEERRRAPRQPFPVVRRIAQTTGQEVPEQAAFFPVNCRDLSTHGFSFLVKTRPQFKSLVLALDAPPNMIFLAAEVRHCTDVLVHPSGRVEVLLLNLVARDDYERRRVAGAEFQVLVGCEFTRRLAVPKNQK